MIDYVVISSDDNPMYKDFYEIVSKKWFDLGYKTYYINITDRDEVINTDRGVIHKIKSLDFISTSLQSQISRLYASNFFNGTMLTSDIDMLPLNKEYFTSHFDCFSKDKVIIYTFMGHNNSNYSFYPMCYVLSDSSYFRKYLDIDGTSFGVFCRDILKTYKNAWNSDENFLFDKLRDNNNVILKTRDMNTRIDRSNWKYDEEKLKNGYYIDSHLLRPFSDYEKEINKISGY